MPALIAAEFLKLRTVRSPWLMLGAAQLIVVAGISGFVVSNGHTLHEAQQGSALGHVGLTSVITLMFGILAVASEYRHKTITDTYLSTPRRDRVIQSKLVVYTLVGGLCGVLASAVGLATAAAWWAGKGASFSWSDARMWQTTGGSIAWNAAFAAIGVGLGALIRNLAGAIAVALAWLALIEGILSQLVGSSLSRWLPFNAGLALGGSGQAGPADPLSRWAGGLVLAAYAVAFAVMAVATTTRRDVA
jgi:ABC-2 type transport system permease protein